MKKKLLLKAGLVMAGATLMLSGCVYREVRYTQGPPPSGYVEAPATEVDVTGPPPPPPQTEVEVQTVAPAGFVWVGEFWAWGTTGWVWHPAHWIKPPRPGVIWVAPHYEFRAGRHVWIRGGWR